MDSLTYSDSFSIYGILDDIGESEFKAKGNASFTNNQWVIGAKKAAWELSLFTRYDYLADYTPDAAFLAYASASETEVNNGDYRTDISLNHSQSHGVRLGYKHDISPNLSFTTRISALEANEIIQGELQGQLSFSETEISDGVLAVDYRFTDDLLFRRDIDKSKGYGLSIDTLVDWQPIEKIALKFSALDVFSQIWWDDLNGTIADATTALSRTDTNGVLIVRPTLQGKNLFGKHTQKLRARYNLHGQFKLSDSLEVSQNIFKMGDNYLSESGINYQLFSETYIGANYEWVSGSPGIKFKWKDFEIGIATDNLDWKKSRYLKVKLGLEHKF